MKTSITGKVLIVVTVIALVGIGSYAFAHRGMGYGHHGNGWHHGGRGGPSYGYMRDNLSDAEVEQLEKARSDRGDVSNAP